MLIDKVKKIHTDIVSQILAGDGYVAVQMNARDVLEMAQALIAVDDAIKLPFEECDSNYKAGFLDAMILIRKAIESTTINRKED